MCFCQLSSVLHGTSQLRSPTQGASSSLWRTVWPDKSKTVNQDHRQQHASHTYVLLHLYVQKFQIDYLLYVLQFHPGRRSFPGPETRVGPRETNLTWGFLDWVPGGNRRWGRVGWRKPKGNFFIKLKAFCPRTGNPSLVGTGRNGWPCRTTTSLYRWLVTTLINPACSCPV